MANPFYVEPVNPLQALMSGVQGYDTANKAAKEQQLATLRDQAGQKFSSGDTQGALAALMQGGDYHGATAVANYANNQSQQDYQRQSLAQTGQYQTGQLAQSAAQLAETGRHNRAAEFNSAKDDSKPVVVQGALVNPKTGEVIYGGTGLSDTALEMTARQVANGDLSGLSNMGRGAQGDQKLTAVRNKAAQILINEGGMSPADAAAHLSKKFLDFKASGIGQNAEARTGATREANLNIILKAADAAIPAALEASDNVQRLAGGFVPLNKIIQKGQVATSDPNLMKFGMANLQLAEHWARAMNPTGVMRESDRDKALEFLGTATSNDTYKQMVGQLRTQIQRERDAIVSVKPGQGAAYSATPAPGSPPSNAGTSNAPTTQTGVPWRIVQ